MRRIAACLSLALSLSCTVAAKAADFSGVWLIRQPSALLRTDGHGPPPLLPAAARQYRDNLKAKAADKPLKDLTQCLPAGPVRVLWAPYPMMVLQTPNKITLVHEYQHLLRHIYLNEPEPEPKPDDLDPTFMGTSTGRWQGDRLVVQTTGFNIQTTLDRSGLPHSDALRLVETFQLIDKGRRLRDRITVIDPKTYARPWSTTAVFDRRPDLELKEYLCRDDNRNG